MMYRVLALVIPFAFVAGAVRERGEERPHRAGRELVLGATEDHAAPPAPPSISANASMRVTACAESCRSSSPSR